MACQYAPYILFEQRPNQKWLSIKKYQRLKCFNATHRNQKRPAADIRIGAICNRALRTILSGNDRGLKNDVAPRVALCGGCDSVNVYVPYCLANSIANNAHIEDNFVQHTAGSFAIFFHLFFFNHIVPRATQNNVHKMGRKHFHKAATLTVK